MSILKKKKKNCMRLVKKKKKKKKKKKLWCSAAYRFFTKVIICNALVKYSVAADVLKLEEKERQEKGEKEKEKRNVKRDEK